VVEVVVVVPVLEVTLPIADSIADSIVDSAGFAIEGAAAYGASVLKANTPNLQYMMQRPY
jgi:hypothetical protein